MMGNDSECQRICNNCTEPEPEAEEPTVTPKPTAGGPCEDCGVNIFLMCPNCDDPEGEEDEGDEPEVACIRFVSDLFYPSL